MNKGIGLIFCFSIILGSNRLFAQYNYSAYFGNLHSHTNLSDGERTPEEAFLYARDTGKLDFMAITDHLEQIDPIEWYNLIVTAGEMTSNGSFVALYGYEWGSPLHGHVNVFNTNTLLFSVGWYYEDWDAFRQWVIDNPPAFCQFNHPGDPTYATTWYNFNYMGGMSDSVFSLMEFQNIQQATDWYSFALSQGWHLSPAWNQDNHSANWGTKDNGRAGIWATGLNKAALLDGMKKRRTFATSDKNASVWLDISGVSMGGTAQRLVDSPCHIRLIDNDNETWTSIEMVTQNGIIGFFGSNSSYLDTIVLISPVTDNWLFIRAIQPDGDYLWSSPVYFSGQSNVEINETTPGDITVFPNPAGDKAYVSFPCYFSPDRFNFRLYDIQGHLLKEASDIDKSGINDRIPINLAGIPVGIYQLNIYYTGVSLFKKLVVIR